jgi:hypothetical protein
MRLGPDGERERGALTVKQPISEVRDQPVECHLPTIVKPGHPGNVVKGNGDANLEAKVRDRNELRPELVGKRPEGSRHSIERWFQPRTSVPHRAHLAAHSEPGPL